MREKVLFFVLLAAAASPLASPALALALGLGFGLTNAHPFPRRSASACKLLLQASVVGLGFGLDFGDLLRVGSSGMAYTAGGIALAMAAGLGLGRLLGVGRTESFLIAAGTAVCGGSAIAALGPATGADDDEMSISLGTVFVLNSIALVLFPIVGMAVGLSEREFGLWAALAIHDTSSVVGATAGYGAAALAVGTAVKLARALWIVPLAAAAAALKRGNSAVRAPWFVGLFAAASLAATWLPAGAPVYDALAASSRVGLTITLFLVGAQVSRATLAKVGVRPLALGLLLWILVASASLALILSGLVAM